MKPYIGILIDSFREAVGNKVLWALLIGWSLVLLALAPFGYVSERSFQLSSADIDDRSALVEKLAKAAKGQGSAPAKAVAAKLDPDFLEKLQQATQSEDQGSIQRSDLAEELNAAITAPGLYSEEAFPTAKRRKRLEPLIEMPADELGTEDLEELNRELVQLAFPLQLNGPRGEQLWIGYAGFKIGDPLPVSRRQINQFLEPIFLGVVIKLGLGVLAIFVAIIVTSPIIPDTFRSGSLHLLLSKPISRVWLYISKFIGGCTFVLLNITFVLIGLYFIAGVRFGIWNIGLLYCIPLLLFVFVVFYSVSGLAGLMWGNSIVCVVACMIFWAFCFGLGFMHDIIMPQTEIMPQISRIRTLDEKLAVVNEKGDFDIWNSEFSIWQPAVNQRSSGQSRVYGPIYDEQRGKILVKSFTRVPFGNPFSRSRKIDMINVAPEADSAASGEETTSAEGDSKSSTPTSVAEAREKAVWVTDPGPDLPAQIFDLLEVGDTVIAVCRGGLFKLDLSKLELIEASEKALFGIKLPWMEQSAFENIAPKDYFLSDNSTSAAHADGQGLAIYSSGNLDYLELVDGKLNLLHNVKLSGDGTEAALVQINSAYCVVARDGLPLEILDAELNSVAQIELPAEQKVKQLAWVPGTNLLSIVTHTGQFLKLDCDGRALESFGFPFNGQCTSVHWIDGSRCYLGVKPNQVHVVNRESKSVEESFVPKPTTLENIFGWAVKPLYKVTPKPAALDNAMSYLLSGSETQTMNIVTNDLEAAQVKLDVWTPIFSNLGFVAVMLIVSCVYVARKEY